MIGAGCDATVIGVETEGGGRVVGGVGEAIGVAATVGEGLAVGSEGCTGSVTGAAMKAEGETSEESTATSDSKEGGKDEGT